ncbi:MAG: hypothetical protein MHM6MM_006832 [Cercozoa sp. M6MM]
MGCVSRKKSYVYWDERAFRTLSVLANVVVARIAVLTTALFLSIDTMHSRMHAASKNPRMRIWKESTLRAIRVYAVFSLIAPSLAFSICMGVLGVEDIVFVFESLRIFQTVETFACSLMLIPLLRRLHQMLNTARQMKDLRLTIVLRRWSVAFSRLIPVCIVANGGFSASTSFVKSPY